MSSGGNEFNYESLSLIRDSDHAELDSQWQKVAENKLAEDDRMKRRSASHKSAKMITRSQSLKRSTSGKVSTGDNRRSSMRDQSGGNKHRGVLLDTKTGVERPMTRGEFTRLTRQAAKLMVSVDAMSSNKESSLFLGCKKWIVAVYTEMMMGMNSGFKFYIRLHGQRRSSKLIELARSETNKFKFQSQQTDVFTLVVQDFGDIEKVTIGFKGIRPGITWRAGLVRLIDAGDDNSRVLEFPIERDLDGDECFVTMPREDLVFDEKKLNQRLMAAQEIELINSSFCLLPDFWYQFGGCQMHVPEIGVCSISQRSSEGVPTGIMQDITHLIKWNGVYDVSFRARLISPLPRGQKGRGRGALGRIVLLSKQESKDKFQMDILASDILYTNSISSSYLMGELEVPVMMESDEDYFHKAYLCFVTEGTADLLLEVEAPTMKYKEDQMGFNLLRNHRFDMASSAVGELWRCSGIGSVESTLLFEDRRSIVLKDRQYQSTGITCNIRDIVQPGRDYQILCDVILYDNPDAKNRNNNKKNDLRDPESDDVDQKDNQNALSSIICCLVTSPTSDDENWKETERRKKSRKQNKNKHKEGKSDNPAIEESRDVITTIAFVQNVGFKKFMPLQGLFETPSDELPSMMTITFHCLDDKFCFGVTNAKLRMIKSQTNVPHS